MIAALVASLLACLVALARVRAGTIRRRVEAWDDPAMEGPAARAVARRAEVAGPAAHAVTLRERVAGTAATVGATFPWDLCEQVGVR